MAPKKAIIIVLILFLIMIMVFAFLYLKKQLASPGDELINADAGVRQNNSAGEVNENKPLQPAEIVEQKIDKIIEEAKKNPTQNTPEMVRQEVISTINAEIIKQERSKTPEQKAADLKAQEARQKIIDQINNQLRQ